MLHSVALITAIAAAVLTACSIGYYALCLWSAVAFASRRKAAVQSARPGQPRLAVSILKPLKGTDPEMYESFRSHCLQDYPDYEIIFGVSDPHDPAIEMITRLRAEFPQRAIQLVVCDKILGANPKVSNLAQMLRQAQYQHLIVSDSDIRVQPDYLRRVTTPLADPQVGLVTCLYRGVPSRTLGSRLESLGISTDFAAGVLAAGQLEGGIRFGLGSTLAFRRGDLESIGGFEAFVDYLADDYELGRRLSQQEFSVQLSELVVETFLPPYTLRQFADHQLRWARAIRDSRPWGYLGLLLTFGLPWSVLALLLSSGARWAWGLLALVACLRVDVAMMVGWLVLRDPRTLGLLPLLPLRDFVALWVWVVSLTGHKVVWRGDCFQLKEGKLMQIGSS